MALQEFPSMQQPDQDQNNIQGDLSRFKIKIPKFDSELNCENLNYQRLLYQKFHNLKQGSRSVEDYAKEFYNMKGRINNIHDSEEQLAIRFISGLRPQLQNVVNQFDPITVQEARYRANLIQHTQHESSWLRTNLFQSKCTINGQVIDFVIDSGCCANLISEEVVLKLALRSESHPNPYCLAWLNQSDEVRISKQVLVRFEMESIYEDKIYCDVVPMDVSHLILGRPWQFDRHVLHHGFANTYTFDFQGRTITLLPNKVSGSSTL